MRLLERKPSSVLAVGVTCALLGAAGAVIAAPGDDGVIRACYPTKTGALRVIVKDGGSCPRGEKALAWNLRGPQGPRGAQGKQGKRGRPGTGAALYANVVAGGLLAKSRSSSGISMTRSQLGDFPVYCFDLPEEVVNVVATAENSTARSTDPNRPPVTMEVVTINASVQPAVFGQWGCPSGTDAAVFSSQRPSGGIYAAFQPSETAPPIGSGGK